MAQVDLGIRSNRNQPLFALGKMAFAVLRAVESRLRKEGGCTGPWTPALRARDALGRRASRSSAAGRARRAAADGASSRRARVAFAAVPLRCVYTDLDNTMLGKGALAAA